MDDAPDTPARSPGPAGDGTLDGSPDAAGDGTPDTAGDVALHGGRGATPYATRGAGLGDWTLAAAFLLGLILPGAGLLLGWSDRDDVPLENRAPAPAPSWPVDAAGWQALPTTVEAWFDDSVAFRTALIRAHNALLVLGLGTSPSPKVTLGRDRWMFIGEDDYADVYRRVEPFSAEQLAQWRGILTERRDWLASLGIEYLLVVPPSKCSVYPEQMPARFDVVRGESRLDQLLDDLTRVARLPLVDLAPSLREGSRHELVYYPLGSHWTPPGAYRAYVDIIDALAPRVPSIGAPWPRTNFDELPDDHHQGDNWAERLHIGDLVTQQVKELVPRVRHDIRELRGAAAGLPNLAWRWENDDRSLPRGMLLHDSFGLGLMRDLALNFSELVTVQHQLDPAVVRELIQATRPDVLIEEIVELGIVRRPPVVLEPGGWRSAPADPPGNDAAPPAKR